MERPGITILVMLISVHSCEITSVDVFHESTVYATAVLSMVVSYLCTLSIQLSFLLMEATLDHCYMLLLGVFLSPKISMGNLRNLTPKSGFSQF